MNPNLRSPLIALALLATSTVQGATAPPPSPSPSPAAVLSTPAISPSPNAPSAPAPSSPSAPSIATLSSPTPCPEGPAGDTGADSFEADLDGDGRADVLGTEGAAGGRFLNVRLASGGTAGVRIGSSAAAQGQPNEPEVLGTADADGDGREEVFLRLASGVADPGTVVRLVQLVGCELVVVRNAQGEPYTFEIRDRADGIGCVDVDGDGRTELVGLHAETSGDRVDWTRTVVRLEGGSATNGAVDGGTFTSPGDDFAIALLGRVTCGDESFPLVGATRPASRPAPSRTQSVTVPRRIDTGAGGSAAGADRSATGAGLLLGAIAVLAAADRPPR